MIITSGSNIITQDSNIVVGGGGLSSMGADMWHAARFNPVVADDTALQFLGDFGLTGKYQLVQNTSGSRPKYKTNILNGLPAIRFDGTDDFMQYGVFDMARNVSGYTFYIVYKRSGGTASENIISWSTGASSVTNRVVYSSNTVTTNISRLGLRRLDADSTVVVEFLANDTVPHVAACVADFTAGFAYVYLDGQIVSTSAVGIGSTSNTDSLAANLGASVNGNTSPYAGDLFEFMYKKAAHNPAQVRYYTNILKSIYGL